MGVYKSQNCIKFPIKWHIWKVSHTHTLYRNPDFKHTMMIKTAGWVAILNLIIFWLIILISARKIIRNRHYDLKKWVLENFSLNRLYSLTLVHGNLNKKRAIKIGVFKGRYIPQKCPVIIWFIQGLY